ncbi:MAG: antitoxin [Thermoprotei archaeon]|nr:MAG: antitoxin [Thermoprotei archaeon]
MMVKTIMIRDEVYKLLVELKNTNESFSDIILRLIKESAEARKRRIEKYFGSLKEDEAKILEEITEKSRKEFKTRI